MMAPSTTARTASDAGTAFSGKAKAKLRMLLVFRVRTAAPANLRSSAAEKVFALPPPKSSRRLAFTPAGLCKSVVSNGLAVTSPLAITSLAASRTAASSLSTDSAGEGAGLSFSAASFSARSSTTTTRQSVSTCDGAEEDRFVFMIDEYQYPRLEGERATQRRKSRA